MRAILAIIFLFVSILNCSANVGESMNGEYTKTGITSLDGLPQNDVHNIIQDSYGFMWIATNDGLCRYDGCEFLIFAKGEFGLDSGLILSLSEDSFGNIWVGTADRGLYYYVRNENRFYHYAELLKMSNIENVEVNNTAFIKIDNSGVVWAYNRQSATILRLDFDTENLRVRSLKLLPMMREFNVLEVKIEAVGDDVYICGGRSIFKYNPATWQFDEVDDIDLHTIAIGLSCQNDWLFISLFDGVLSYNTKTHESRFSYLGYMPEHLSWIDDSLWFTTSKGLYNISFDQESGEFGDVEQVDEYNNLMSRVIVEDHIGGIWVGFIKIGIERYRRRSAPFSLRSDLGNNLITDIVELGGGKICVGTGGCGAYIMDGIDGALQGNIFKDATIYALEYQSSNNMLYVSTQSQLYAVDLGRNRAEKLLLDRMSIRDIVLCGDDLWLATYDNGLIRYSLESGDIMTLTVQDGLPSSIVRGLMKDHKGNLWITTSRGVVSISADELKRSRPRFRESLFEQSVGQYAIPIIEDRDGDVWYGTLGSGLYRLRASEDGDYAYRTERYTVDDGLSSNIIKSFVCGDDGELWLSTNKGVCRVVKGDSIHIESYDVNQDLLNYEFSELSSVRLLSGEMLFGGVRGISYFDPSELTVEQMKSLPIVTDLKLSGVSLFDMSNIEDVVPTGLYGDRGVVLDYDQNNFSIKFTGLNYSAPESNRYRYQLKGFNPQMVDAAGGVTEINYTNLQAGNYLFVLRAVSGSGVWSDEAFELPITIKPPFWATWYAYLLYMVLFGLVIYYSVTSYHNEMKRRNIVSQTKFEQRKVEEMLENRTRFFTNVSHELRTPLTLILSPLQQLLNEEDIASNPRWERSLKMMNYSGRSLMRLINSLLSYSKQQSGVLVAELHCGDLREFAHRHFEQFAFWAEQREISLRFISADRVSYVDFDPYLMEQIISNLLSNAIKYTQSQGSVTFMIEEQDDSVVMSVKDSGAGIPEDQQQGVFERYNSRSNSASREIGGTGIGLYVTSKLVESHGGEIWFESSTDAESHGTTFYVKLPKSSSPVEDLAQSESDVICDAPVVNTQIESQLDDANALKPHFELEGSDGSLPSLLIVDDNRELRILLRKLFSDYYEITEAEDGVEAWELSQKMIPDIILSDVMMPNMNGLEFCERVKSHEATSHIPVVLLSAKASSEDMVAGLRISADAYCPKPFDNRVLVEVVNSTLINRRRLAAKYLSAERSDDRGEQSNAADECMSNMDVEFMRRVSSFIKENMHSSEFVVNDICEYMGLTRLILNKKLKSLTNMTAIGLIRTHRLQRAAELLRTSRYNVSDVTFDVGFNDLRHFRECFKKEFGVLPQEYKEQHTKGDKGADA